MFLNTGELHSTNVISLVSLIIACFVHLNPGQAPSGWAAVLIRHYPLVDGFQLLAFLFNHNQLELLSEACAILFTTLLAYDVPILNIFQSDGAWKIHDSLHQ